jgi:hypothetical protein
MSTRAYLVIAFCLAAGAGAVAVDETISAFSNSASNSGNTFSAAASFGANIQFVKTVGSASCGATSNAVTVPAGGVTAGNTLVVRVVIRGTVAGAVSVTDSKGNTYTNDADVTNTNLRVVVFSAQVGTALAENDTISVTHPNVGSSSIVVGEFSGIASATRVDVTGPAIGDSATPSASVSTTNADDLVYATVGDGNGRTYTEPAGWTTHAHLFPQCGGAGGNSDNHGAYRIVSATGTYTYDPTLSSSARWAEAIVAYKAG